MEVNLDFDAQHVTITLERRNRGLISSLFSKSPETFTSLGRNNKAILFGLADLRATAEQYPDELLVSDTNITMSHNVCSRLSSEAAQVIGLPRTIDFTFSTDVDGIPGSNKFKLLYKWLHNGQQQVVDRTGSILRTSYGLRRIPHTLLEAIEIADMPDDQSSLENHWEKLALFKRSLAQDLEQDDNISGQAMSSFLQGLEVQIADSFSILPNADNPDFDYDVLPFSTQTLDAVRIENGNAEISNQMAELDGTALNEFQKRVRTKGALPAFKVGSKKYLVVDRSATPALKVIAEMHHASPAERQKFIKNPRLKIDQAIEKDLRGKGLLEGLNASEQAELIENSSLPLFIETKEYSERVTGKTIFSNIQTGQISGSGTTWLPEYFPEETIEALKKLNADELKKVRDDINNAMTSGDPTIQVDKVTVAANPMTKHAIETQIASLETEVTETESLDDDPQATDPLVSGPIILDIQDNLVDLRWRASIKRRIINIPRELPQRISTDLRPHQNECLDWQMSCWESGLPGILNADEQGLGKTLETIAFLAWLQDNLSNAPTVYKGPMIIVAPTTLLENWEKEVADHLEDPKLGHLIRLYGSGISALKKTGARGTETVDGEERLDLEFIHNAIKAGDGHKFWILTTYTTLTNYQHSLGTIKFSCAVFDEIQALKNPQSLSSFAGLTLNSDFRIGLTGTPIENSTVDLWAITEQIFSGRLGSKEDFLAKYSDPDLKKSRELHSIVFKPTGTLPPIGLRRLKEEVAKDLPSKTRILYPKIMPEVQAANYEAARNGLTSSTTGGVLKILHHIRSVSVHPNLHTAQNEQNFIDMSGRMTACFEILDSIKQKNERALVFIEHIQLQYRFIELIKDRYNLQSVDLINGSTPIKKRQEIVNRFQRHLINDDGFDVLVLGPKAAGTGLTLTAATNVIHLSRWWNPAVEEQCNDRVHRIGQTQPVRIHIPMSIHKHFREDSFDCLLHSLMTKKRKLAKSTLWPLGDTSSDTQSLQQGLSSEVTRAISGNPINTAMEKMFQRDKTEPLQVINGEIYYYE